MFDLAITADAGAWCTSSIVAVKERLVTALESGSGLDDAGRVESIGALEELVRVATAAQAALTRELDTSQRAMQAEAGLAAEHRGRGVALQVALARRESHHRGKRHLGLAKVIATELPHTWAAWRTGVITEHAATLAVRETACLELEDRLEVDRLLAGTPDARASLATMGEREVAGFCAKHAARLDPASVVARRRKAEEDRCVTLRPAPDTMTYLTALLPVKDGVAAYAALTQAADAARADGTDERTKGQVMTDTLVSAILGGHEATRGPKVELGLVMSDHTAFGTSDDPAHLDGYGPIPAELGREILAGALTTNEEVWVRRLYTSPTTGELVAMDSRARQFPAGLARFIRLRDQVCRTPWCTAPIRHSDHADAVIDGGPTTGENGQGLCEACNYAKQAPGWRARPSPAGTIETLTPTGHRHHTRPPALVTIHDRPPIRID
ncbi:HNH endonuclease [Nocardioides sp. SYSU DS0663]|uniref:HNH endonuclease n=1 Tax=Nocardioides sp. SYSU DS0663 TaxID=3416445 RepID=UPI003F4BF3E2